VRNGSGGVPGRGRTRGAHHLLRVPALQDAVPGTSWITKYEYYRNLNLILKKSRNVDIFDATGPIILTIALAFFGYLVTYYYNLKLIQKQEQLARINKQISDFYGPMLAILKAGDKNWDYLSKTFHNSKIKGPALQIPGGAIIDVEIWKHWMREVFMPSNLKIENIIINHSDLLDDKEFPDELLSVVAHINAYKVILKKWENDDYSELFTQIVFPREELHRYVNKNYNRLKSIQLDLLGLKK
jgi:hypothetical protein